MINPKAYKVLRFLGFKIFKRMKSSLLFLTLLLVAFSCNEITSEILDIEDCKIGNQIALLGYLSNYGVVVSIQKASSALDTTRATAIAEASVYLFNSADSMVCELTGIDEFLYVTNEDFIPQAGEYYVTVSAQGFPEIRSGKQALMEFKGINDVTMNIKQGHRELGIDTLQYTLFGYPRNIELTFRIDNSDLKIDRGNTRLLFGYNNKVYGKYGFNFFGNVFIAEKVIELPDQVSDTIVYLSY